MIAELAALALTCAPNIHPITLHALISHESRGRRYAIGVNRKGMHLQQPRSLTEATEAAQHLIDQGIDFDAGLGQINVRNWSWLNLDTKTIFDPCRNLAAAQTVLADCYARSLPQHTDPQQALRAALSCYNTGNFTRGFTNGYVGKILAKADIKVPALAPLKAEASDPAKKGESPKPPSTQNSDLGQPTQVQGTPDGFIANPATDGFAQKHDKESKAQHGAAL
ncbi:lytic transglycosylase domain-containing protein [Pusillimonas sp. ANT_WB101]|uniref:lytic transglycosylase domain-containing protein n=1 Tax=Pusillimonas sp. ANT_WB101 TaxID=2597356 RepID=UPI0011EE5989|nr:lytic transglycosylase domain-containing protein [Pusillimonas sp. ANT_WB101]KAA0892468.1 lytic transglycosylase domain-containing protein [Pusillimonas sp. ANT_WB101]